jgi:hypothetical protein
VHELVVGECRADLAAIEPERLILFEVKSEKDTLDRLPRQVETFSRLAHAAVVVAHEKWFDRIPYNNGTPRLVFPHDARRAHVWCWPEVDTAAYPMAFVYRWQAPRTSLRQPRAYDFLQLMWRDEMATEAARHRISAGPRASMVAMAEQMAYLMTGREIAQAVCRQLRQRPFPEADPPKGETP